MKTLRNVELMILSSQLKIHNRGLYKTMKFKSSLKKNHTAISLGTVFVLTTLSFFIWFGCQESPMSLEQAESKSSSNKSQASTTLTQKIETCKKIIKGHLLSLKDAGQIEILSGGINAKEGIRFRFKTPEMEAIFDKKIDSEMKAIFDKNDRELNVFFENQIREDRQLSTEGACIYKHTDLSRQKSIKRNKWTTLEYYWNVPPDYYHKFVHPAGLQIRARYKTPWPLKDKTRQKQTLDGRNMKCIVIGGKATLLPTRVQAKNRKSAVTVYYRVELPTLHN